MPHRSLFDFIQRYPRLLVITGAGISTDSGIPDYRDQEGQWKRKQPVQHGDFMKHASVRQRYWGRSLIGWPVMRDAQPNAAHQALAELEALGHIELLVTQNVDSLHQQAGSQNVIDLHGRSNQVRCMHCDYQTSRNQVHHLCAELNPDFTQFSADTAPDGDADLEVDFSHFNVPNCPVCDGLLKPDVVFFGDNVPKARVEQVSEALDRADALLIIGSSLMVFSGFRFCRYAAERGKPMAALTLGKTRADDLLTLKVSTSITPTLTALVAAIKADQPLKKHTDGF